MAQNSKTSFRRLFLMLCLMLLAMSIVMGFFSYFFVNSYLKREYYQRSNEALEQTRNLIEEALGTIERDAMALALDSSYQKYVLLPTNENDIYPIWTTLVENFNNRLVASAKIDSIYLYPLDSSKKILSNFGAIDRDMFPDVSFIQAHTGKDYPVWSAPRKFLPFYASSQGPVDVISYVQPVPGTNGPPRGYLVVNLRFSWFRDAIATINSEGDTAFSVINRDGEVLTSTRKSIIGTEIDDGLLSSLEHGSGTERRIYTGDRNSITFAIFSERYRWYYVIATPVPSAVRNPLLAQILIAVVGVFALLGVVISLGVSSRFLKPWSGLLRTIANETDAPRDGMDDVGYFDHSFHKLKQEKDDYASRLEQVRSFQEDYYYRLLVDGAGSGEGVPSPDKGPYVMLCLRIDSAATETAMEDAGDFWTKALLDVGMQSRFIHYGYSYCVIIGWAADGEEEYSLIDGDVTAWVRKLMPVFRAKTGAAFSVILPPHPARTEDLAASFGKARACFEHGNLIPSDSVSIAEDILASGADERSLLEFEEKASQIGTVLRTAEEGEIVEGITRFVGEVLSTDDLSLSQKNAFLMQLVHAIRLVLLQANGSVEQQKGGNRSLFYEYEHLPHQQSVREWFEKLARNVSSYLSSRRLNKSSLIAEQAVAWIRENYRDEIYTQKAAEIFGLSEPYFCKLVRAHTGKTFGRIVSELRVDAVAEELISTGDSLDIIAGRTGFGSTRNLLRAFSKIRGETPGAYRRREKAADVASNPR